MLTTDTLVKVEDEINKETEGFFSYNEHLKNIRFVIS